MALITEPSASESEASESEEGEIKSDADMEENEQESGAEKEPVEKISSRNKENDTEDNIFSELTTLPQDGGDDGEKVNDGQPSQEAKIKKSKPAEKDEPPSADEEEEQVKKSTRAPTKSLVPDTDDDEMDVDEEQGKSTKKRKASVNESDLEVVLDSSAKSPHSLSKSASKKQAKGRDTSPCPAPKKLSSASSLPPCQNKAKVSTLKKTTVEGSDEDSDDESSNSTPLSKKISTQKAKSPSKPAKSSPEKTCKPTPKAKMVLPSPVFSDSDKEEQEKAPKKAPVKVRTEPATPKPSTPKKATAASPCKTVQSKKDKAEDSNDEDGDSKKIKGNGASPRKGPVVWTKKEEESIGKAYLDAILAVTPGEIKSRLELVWQGDKSQSKTSQDISSHIRKWKKSLQSATEAPTDSFF